MAGDRTAGNGAWLVAAALLGACGRTLVAPGEETDGATCCREEPPGHDGASGGAGPGSDDGGLCTSLDAEPSKLALLGFTEEDLILVRADGSRVRAPKLSGSEHHHYVANRRWVVAFLADLPAGATQGKWQARFYDVDGVRADLSGSIEAKAPGGSVRELARPTLFADGSV